MITIGLNGFGRIGRNFLRTIYDSPETSKSIQVAAINVGPADPKFIAHSFKYDTLLGMYPGDVKIDGNYLVINGHKIRIYAEPNPAKIRWSDHAISWVVEASGKFTAREDAALHITAGAQHVLISAPSDNADVTIILGVNDHEYIDQQIVSLGSCTTNAVAPMLKVIDRVCGVESAYMTTVHAYTNDQVLLDVDKKDPRRARAAGLNIVPTTTGAMKVVAKVLPQLTGKVEGCAIRVPVAKVSLVDLSFIATQPITKELLHSALEEAKKTDLKNILDITFEPLVSSDFNENDHSVVIDGQMTQVVGRLGKVFGWYDNEWVYSVRLKDFLLKYAE
jgi:glyceraldehyde 3-phosphate dehydrogenase